VEIPLAHGTESLRPGVLEPAAGGWSERIAAPWNKISSDLSIAADTAGVAVGLCAHARNSDAKACFVSYGVFCLESFTRRWLEGL
jgi:hypothetical protein